MSDNILNVSSSNFWDKCYRDDDTGWDIGAPTPIFVDWCNKLNTKKEICIPGCGNGHDLLYFANQGHKVTGIDFADSPIKKIKSKLENKNLNANLVKCDIFELSKKFNSTFDYVIEYTCYCAINPNMRNRYINVVFDLLKDGGEFVGIFLPLNKDLSEGGPPFGVNIDETIYSFSKKFKLIESFKHPLSIEPRFGNEQFVRFIK